MTIGTYSVEIANRIGRINGRTVAVGTEYVVTRRPIGYSAILFRCASASEAVAWATEAHAADASLPGSQ